MTIKSIYRFLRHSSRCKTTDAGERQCSPRAEEVIWTVLSQRDASVLQTRGDFCPTS